MGWAVPTALLTLALMRLLVFTTAAHGQTAGDFSFQLSSGYSLGDLRWNIAGPFGSPNILSELTWSKLQVYQIEGEGEFEIRQLTIRATAGFGWILVGDNQDSDYNSDDRTDEFSRSHSDAAGGYIFHAQALLGYRYDLRSGSLRLIPIIGIAFHRQGMVMTDGVQIIPADGPFADLSSTYATNWISASLGLELAALVSRRLRFGAAVSVHPAIYYAQADWNLRTDFAHPVSFEHRTFGWGFSGDLSAGVAVSRRVLLEGRFGLDYWFAGPGVDETYLAAGGSVTTRLNEVVWRSLELSIGTVLRL